MHEDPDILEPIGRRSWSPGFWERMHRLADEVDPGVPEPLPGSPYRDAILDQLGPDSDELALDSPEEVEKRGWPPGFWERFDNPPPVSEDFSELDDV